MTALNDAFNRSPSPYVTDTGRTMIQNNNGMTLIEVLVAIVVLGIGVIGVMTMTSRATLDNTRSSILSNQVGEASEQIETFAGVPYDHFDLNDDDGDGTGQDANNDGTDDNFGDFGLNDFPGCNTVLQNRGNVWGCTPGAADGTATRGDYTIHWNVAINYPINLTKTIRFFVFHPNKPNQPVILEYIKSQGL